ncbi:MAG: CmcJ/NvfI family oxidoreductase [Novosphingobium sp.]
MSARQAQIAYVARDGSRPFYYANAHEKDRVPIDLRAMPVRDARTIDAHVDREGFQLVRHRSAITDWTDRAALDAVHRGEVAALIKDLTGADEVQVNTPGILRYSEKSGKAGSSDNSHPARFVHVDINDVTAAQFAERGSGGRAFKRCAAYNLWRALSPAPQDVPLALCDVRTVTAEDLIVADAIFDPPPNPDGTAAPEWSFESWVVAHNPAHRWHFYSDLAADEAVLFKTNDSDPARAHCMPHVAFDDPLAPADAPPRVSIEMRATCFWWA